MRFLLFIVLILSASDLSAHQTGKSVFIAHVKPDHAVDTLLTLPLRDIVSHLELDDGDGEWSAEEIALGRPKLSAYFSKTLAVKNGDKTCDTSEIRLGPTSSLDADVWFLKAYRCDAPNVVFSVETLFESKGGFVHFGNIEVDGVVKTTIFDPVRSTYTVGSEPPSFLRFLELGFVHVAIGLDHILFLLGLIVCATRFKDLIGLATTFTIAHATTIVVSALGWFTIAPAVIEPAIALTIVAIGLEARRESIRYPTYLIVAGLGLIHGFGFSYALRDVGLPAGDEALALFGFNLGVEAAQIVFVTVIAGLLAIPVWREKITQNHRKWVGRAISLIGIIWFGMRLLG